MMKSNFVQFFRRRARSEQLSDSTESIDCPGTLECKPSIIILSSSSLGSNRIG